MVVEGRLTVACLEWPFIGLLEATPFSGSDGGGVVCGLELKVEDDLLVGMGGTPVEPSLLALEAVVLFEDFRRKFQWKEGMVA